VPAPAKASASGVLLPTAAMGSLHVSFVRTNDTGRSLCFATISPTDSPDPGARAGASGAPASASGTPARSVTRERILHATLRVIAEGGVGAVTNRRVATEAGVALGSLTYHFPSQTELLRDSLLRYVEEEVARLGAIADALRAASPTPEQVAEAVEQLLDSDPTRPG